MDQLKSLQIARSKSSCWMVVLVVVSVLMSSECLHISHEQDGKQYDKEVYLSQLSGIEARYKKDITNIKNQFQQINLKLSNTNISSSDNVIFLQETLAQERDALFNIQTYLNIPFALRSCQCINVTQEQKESITAQIEKVNDEIDSLQQSLLTNQGAIYENPQCPKGDCAAVKQIQGQIDQLKNYQKVMKATVTSECCKITNYFYRDNLADSSKWMYGNLTEKDYRLATFQRSKQHNLTQCPQSRPFANIATNECVPCPSTLPIFRLDNRTCVKGCDNPAQRLLFSIHNCDYNKECTSGTYFNNKTFQCQKRLGTNSWCPRDKPTWNQKTYSCQKCPSSAPYYDSIVVTCRTCTANQKWVEELKVCTSLTETDGGCSKGMYYNNAKKICEEANTVPSSGTFSKCPPQAPFWSNKEYACFKCPSQTPNYNLATKRCEQCPHGTQWSPVQSSCAIPLQKCQNDQNYDKQLRKCVKVSSSTCPSGEIFNALTQLCEKINNNGQIGLCPPEKPMWDNQKMSCERCQMPKPLWNTSTSQCDSCPDNTIWQPLFEVCRPAIPTPPPPKPTTCSNGQVYNAITKKCQANVCTGSTPRRNPSTGRCEKCPSGTQYNIAKGLCEEIKIAPPSRTNTSICHSQQPYWNAQRMRCQECPIGHDWDPSENTCSGQPSNVLSHANHQSILSKVKASSHLDVPKVNHLKLGLQGLTLQN